MHPRCHTLPHALLKGEAEGAVTTVATGAGELLSSEVTLRRNSLLIEPNEMIDTQIVDIDVERQAQAREILAEIGTIGAKHHGQLMKGEVVLHIQLRVHTLLC